MSKKTDGTVPPRVPAPPHPHRRRVPLPWCRPKPGEEDPEAPAHLKSILESPSYRQADQDIDFLGLDETRGVRLQIDYEKAELLLRKREIRHTIVVFGSTRIHEPRATQAGVSRLRELLAAEPDNRDLQR